MSNEDHAAFLRTMAAQMWDDGDYEEAIEFESEADLYEKFVRPTNDRHL